MPDRSSTLWEGVRRALGRLVSSVSVSKLADGEFSVQTRMGDRNLLAAAPCQRGTREQDWRPTAATTKFLIPSAADGGRGADLAAMAVVIGIEGALTPESTPVYDTMMAPNTAATYPYGLLEGTVQKQEVHARPMALQVQAGPEVQTVLAAARVEKLTVAAPALARKKAPTGQRAAADPAQLPAFARIRTTSSLAACAEAPVTRARLAAPVGLRFAEAFAAERRQLAQTNSIELGDVALVGIYRDVPLVAVRRLTLGSDGESLSLWLKPESLQAAASGKALRLSTLIIGRERSTGRMIRAVA